MRFVPAALAALCLVGEPGIAQAKDRVILESVTEVYLPMPPGRYYPVAQGIFGSRREPEPAFVYVPNQAVRPSQWWSTTPPDAYVAACDYDARRRTEPWLPWAVVATPRADCRGCLTVNVTEPIVIRRYERPKPRVRHKPKVEEWVPERQVEPIEDRGAPVKRGSKSVSR